MLYPTLTSTTDELQQILQLQKQNLRQHIDETEMKSQGFVTIHHDLNILRNRCMTWLQRLSSKIMTR